jgi:pimeloyl-ACP methyl ester carboxylesterase
VTRSRPRREARVSANNLDPNPRRKPPEKVTLGVLLVHGIGKQSPGDALKKFGDPIEDWMSRALTDRSTGAEGVRRVPCGDCGLKSLHRHLNVTARSSGGGKPRMHRWIIAECYWDDVVQGIDYKTFSQWVGRVTPLVAIWQIGTSLIAGVYRRRIGGHKYNPIVWFAFLCSTLWNLLLRPPLAYLLFATALLVPVLAPNASKASRLDKIAQLLTLVIGDAYAFVADNDLSAALRERFSDRYNELSQLAGGKVVVIGHSQGGALAHASLKRSGKVPAAFVGVGSGLGPLLTAEATKPRRFIGAQTLLGFMLGLVAWGVIGSGVYRMLVWATWVAIIIAVGAVLLAAVLLGILVSVLAGGISGAVNFAETVRNTGLDLPSALDRVLGLLFEQSVYFLVSLVLAAPLLWLMSKFYIRGRLTPGPSLALPNLPPDRWYEFYSPLDPVCIGTPVNKYATRIRVHNPTGWRIWREHGDYFAPGSVVVPRLSSLLGSVDRLDLDLESLSAPPGYLKWRIVGFEAITTIAWLGLYFVAIQPRF